MKCPSQCRYLKIVFSPKKAPYAACCTCGKKSKSLRVTLVNVKDGFQEFIFEEVKK